MSKWKLCIGIGSIGMFILSLSAHAGEVGPSLKGPAFKAQIKVSNKHMPGMLNKSDVWVSKHGVRIEVKGPDGQKMINLLKKDGAYMLFPEQRIYMTTMDIEEGAASVETENPLAVFSNAPCAGYTKSTKSSTSAKLAGRSVDRWLCKNAQGIDDTVEYYAPDLQRVIKSQSPDGTVTELLNIVKKPIPKKMFEIPSGYQNMSLTQMMMPNSLPSFNESNVQ